MTAREMMILHKTARVVAIKKQDRQQHQRVALLATTYAVHNKAEAGTVQHSKLLATWAMKVARTI
jgi:hypothetical protein